MILLKEVEGHSVEELAAMTGLNENTIKVKLFRTRQKLLKAAQRLNRVRPLSKIEVSIVELQRASDPRTSVCTEVI